MNSFRLLLFPVAPDIPIHSYWFGNIYSYRWVSKPSAENRKDNCADSWQQPKRPEGVLAKCATTTLVYRPVQPLATVKRYIMLIPADAEKEVGFPYWLVRVWNLARNSGSKILFYGNRNASENEAYYLLPQPFLPLFPKVAGIFFPQKRRCCLIWWCLKPSLSPYTGEIAGKTLHYTRDERLLLFGLTNAQAAATLAAVMVGYQVILGTDVAGEPIRLHSPQIQSDS